MTFAFKAFLINPPLLTRLGCYQFQPPPPPPPHVTSWLCVILSTSLALHLDPIEFRVAVKWWLDLDAPQCSQCAFCPAQSLDPLGHHALTCKCGGDAISRHNALRDTLAHFLHRAHASIEVEAGAGLFPDHSQSRPADILAQHWNHRQPVALDISVVSPLNPGERLVHFLRQRRAGNTRPMMRNA